MSFDLPILGVGLLWEHPLVIFALMIFIGTLIYLFTNGMLISAPGFSLFVFSLSSILVLFPLLVYSSNRDYVLSNPCQWYILGIAVTWAIAVMGFMRKPSPDISYPELRWRFVPQRVWLVLLALACLLDPIITIVRFGKIGLIHGNEMMGAGGSHADVITAATVIGWECGSVASTMLQTDFFVSRVSWKEFLFQRRKWFDLGLVLFCLACNSTTGNRFILVMNVLCFASGLAIFGRLRTRPALVGATILLVFFTVIGNYRIGRADIKEKLTFETQIKFLDSSLGWIATYTEPIFPTLDTFLQNAPSPAWGGAWLNNIGPTVLRGTILNKDRSSPIEEMYEIIPHFGLTFRTMYSDLIFDFGDVGSLIVGMVILFLSIILYNRSTQSARSLAIYLNTFQMFAFMPLLATFYTQVPFMSFAITLVVSTYAPPQVDTEIEETQDLPNLV
ncbi:O-antigen polymerase [Schlesneria paludicola]|uniref:O-antigen polymerase n=1 Tax=Schlesneria paludicola TaxID=360056 RepID=UPI000299FBE4|nr:O-antigen polymerase [Schlesneria paludicola]